MTCTELITRAVQTMGCLRAGQTTSPDILAEGRTQANNMLEAMLLDKLLVPAQRGDLYTLTGGIQQYTIGPTSPALPGVPHFVAARPTRIEEANVLLNTSSPAVRRPIYLARDPAEWASIRVQNLPFAIPQVLWYDGNFTPTPSPSGQGYATLNLWPGPLAAYQLELYTWQQIGSFADLTTDYRFAPGYAQMLEFNLAKTCGPRWRIQFKMPQQLFDQQYAMVKLEAARMLEELRAYNAPEALMECDPTYCGDSGQGAFNYLTGMNGRS